MAKQYWIISEFYHPCQNATGHIMTSIVDRLSKQHPINVITVGGIGTDDRNKNITTIRVKDSTADKNNLLQRLLKLIILTFRLLIKVIGGVKRGDTVAAVTNPAFLLIFIAFLRTLRKFRFILIVHDVFPENLLVLQLAHPHSFKYKLSKRIFDWSYNKADQLICCGSDMTSMVQTKVKDPSRVMTIPNFANTESLIPSIKSNNKILQDLGIADKFVVLFTGNIGRMQDISNVVSAASLLKSHSDIYFLFIGDGAMVPVLEQYIASGGSNVIHLSNMDRSRSNDFLNAGDIGLVTLMPNMMGTGVPSKTYSYLAVGHPILAVMDKDTEISNMVSDYDLGWVCQAGDADALAQLIINIKENPESLKQKGINSYQLSQTTFNEVVLTDRYAQEILKY